MIIHEGFLEKFLENDLFSSLETDHCILCHAKAKGIHRAPRSSEERTE